MSLTASVVMVRADARGEMRRILEQFDCQPMDVEQVRGWEAVLEALRYPRPDKPREIVHKAATWCRGWTVILDPELVLMENEAPCAALAGRHAAPVFAMICQGTSSTYAFSLYDPDLRRSFWICDGRVQDDRGTPLPEEAGIDLPLLFEDGVVEIMSRLGVRYQDLERAAEFDVWALDESHLVVPAQARPAGTTRPWWKIWAAD